MSYLGTLLLPGEISEKKRNKPPTLSRFTAIQWNPHFPQEIQHQGFLHWSRKGLEKFGQLFHEGSWKPKTFAELKREFDLTDKHLIHLHQVTSFWKGFHLPPSQIFSTTFMDSLVSSQKFATAMVYPKIRTLFLELGNNTFDTPSPPGKRILGFSCHNR